MLGIVQKPSQVDFCQPRWEKQALCQSIYEQGKNKVPFLPVTFESLNGMNWPAFKNLEYFLGKIAKQLRNPKMPHTRLTLKLKWYNIRCRFEDLDPTE